MLSVKRFVQILAILAIFTTAFWMIGPGGSYGIMDYSNQYTGTTPEIQTQKLTAAGSLTSCLLVGIPQDETEEQIRDNIEDTLKSMRIPYAVKGAISAKDLKTSASLVFISSNIGKAVQMSLLGDFIINGGHALFAAGLPEANQDTYLNPVWDIAEKGNRFALKEVHIAEGFFPYGETTAVYNGFTPATRVVLNGYYQVLMETSDHVPIVYGGDYQNGRVMVINASILSDTAARGIFCAALAHLDEELIYPILGVKTVCLDGFPQPGSVYDKNCLSLYGRNTESFLWDVLWPDLESCSNQYGLKYTANVLTTSYQVFELVGEVQRQLGYFGRKILNANGELAFAGEHWLGTELDLEKVEEMAVEIGEKFPQYQFSSYSVINGVLSPGEWQELNKRLGGMEVLRGVWAGDPEMELVQPFGTGDGYVTYPRVTKGFTEDSMLTFLSALASCGVVSHGFPIRELLSADSVETGWDGVREGFGHLGQDYFGATPWLRSATLTESASAAVGYEALEMTASKGRDGVKVRCSGFLPGQAFYLYSTRGIMAGTGCTVVRAEGNYWMVTAQEADFTLQYS